MSSEPERLHRRLADAAGVVVLCIVVVGLVRLYSRTIEEHYPLAEAQALIVDVNRDPLPYLELLPGIGPVMARRIIDERSARGPFRDLEDLERRIPGIGRKTVERLRSGVRFSAVGRSGVHAPGPVPPPEAAGSDAVAQEMPVPER
ncbi:MAG: DUF655 domain-containing protein [Planctomycetota bacterium]